MRHKGGGHKQHYRVVDFRRDKDGIEATVERLEYDPNRSAHLALLLLRRRRAPLHHRAEGPDRGNAAAVGRGSADQAGQHAAAAQHSGRHHGALHRDACPARARSSRARRAPRCSCWRAKAPTRSCGCARARSARCTSIAAPPSARSATRSTTWNRSARRAASAGAASEPTVRGVAMNPIDHPHGGGEGRTSSGRPPVSPWGVQTKGFKTRRNKRTQVMIVRDRRTK